MPGVNHIIRAAFRILIPGYNKLGNPVLICIKTLYRK